jgi:phage baseplate assembly protein W
MSGSAGDRRFHGRFASSLESRAFLGVGWAFPLGFTATGGAAMAVLEEDVAQAIRIILGTNPGERVMRPDFGAGLDDFLFEPASATTLERVRVRVETALIDWEPRIDLVEVRVEVAGTLRNRIDVEVRYRVRATNTLHNLVYPFYLDEGAGE